LTIAVIQGKQIVWHKKLHEKYGSVVRVAPDALTYTDERAWADICGSTPAAKYGMEKDERLLKLIGDDMTSPNPDLPRAEQKHTLMRRAYAPSLTKQALKIQEPLIMGHVNELLQSIGSKCHKPVDMVDMMCFIIYDTFSDLFLGESLNLFKDSTYRQWVHSFDSFAKGTTIMAALQHYSLFLYILPWLIKKYGAKKRDYFLDVIHERFDRRVAAKTDRKDLLHFAMQEKIGLSIQDLRAFAPFLMIGGCETTPTLLSGLIFHLSRSKNCLEELNKEIRTAFESEDEITRDRMFELQYLDACLQESSRLLASVGGGVDRMVPKTGAMIAGKFVPGGTVVNVLHQVTFTASRNFNRAEEFHPERWLPNPAMEFAADRKLALRPFSVGPQSCFGQE
jgi:cytochrome P450